VAGTVRNAETLPATLTSPTSWRARRSPLLKTFRAIVATGNGASFYVSTSLVLWRHSPRRCGRRCRGPAGLLAAGTFDCAPDDSCCFLSLGGTGVTSVELAAADRAPWIRSGDLDRFVDLATRPMPSPSSRCATNALLPHTGLPRCCDGGSRLLGRASAFVASRRRRRHAAALSDQLTGRSSGGRAR